MSAPFTYPRHDPPHLHLAAVALAYPVLSGALGFIEAAGSLALAAIHAGLFDQMTDRQFDALRSRLERSLVRATIEIEHREADRIRAAIASPIASRKPRELILLVARAANQASRNERVAGHAFEPLPDEAMVEICRQEVRKVLDAMRDAGRVAHG